MAELYSKPNDPYYSSSNEELEAKPPLSTTSDSDVTTSELVEGLSAIREIFSLTGEDEAAIMREMLLCRRAEQLAKKRAKLKEEMRRLRNVSTH